MYAGLTLVTPPAGEPISVADAKLHSRIDVDADDGLVAANISAARQFCEHRTRRAFLPQTWRLALRSWPGRNAGSLQPFLDHSDTGYRNSFIELPRPPLQSIVSFTYADVNGDTANMTQGYGSASGNYLLDTDSEPGRIYLPFSGLWPTTILAPGAPILITFRAGYPSYSGTVNVQSGGRTITWVSGDKFSASIAGTFIQIKGVSTTVLEVASDTSLTVAQPVDVSKASAVSYSANAVPHAIKQAMLFMAAHFYENREMVVVGRTAQIATEVPFTVDHLLADYRNFHAVQPSAA